MPCCTSSAEALLKRTRQLQPTVMGMALYIYECASCGFCAVAAMFLVPCWWLPQHPYFYETQEPPCQPNQLPKLPDCHEWTTKKRKHNQQQHHAPQAGYNGPHHHPAGGAHYPGHHSGR